MIKRKDRLERALLTHQCYFLRSGVGIGNNITRIITQARYLAHIDKFSWFLGLWSELIENLDISQRTLG